MPAQQDLQWVGGLGLPGWAGLGACWGLSAPLASAQSPAHGQGLRLLEGQVASRLR